MSNDNFYEELKKYALDSNNYKTWREEHTKVFGALFRDSFSQNEEAKICLTAALINISHREFDRAMPKLDMLESLCATELDEIAITYFKGLNYEMLANESLMEEYYERLKVASVIPKFSLAFHPYYRTAKFAQRDSECKKSMYYYRKALEFYDGQALDPHLASIANRIIYDIATLCLYMHEYDECERFLKASYQYDRSQNQQREYVRAILLAVQDKREDCIKILGSLNPVLRHSCQALTDAIFNRTDPHYCIVSQDRSSYEKFWDHFLQEETTIKKMVSNGAVDEAQRHISQMLTKTFSFAKRTLECRIEKKADIIVVGCKNYRARSLVAEQSALIAIKPEGLSNWAFVSVDDFESF